MKTLAEKFLTQFERDRVTQAVKKAELQTSGEIVPMVVSHSHDYPRATLLASLLYSFLASYGLAYILSTFLWMDFLNINYFVLLFMPLFFLFFWVVKKYPALARLFITSAEMEVEVEEEATKCFFTENLYKTKDDNGILLFISVFEKKAWILADSGINEQIEQGEWQEVMDTLTAQIRSNNRGEARCEAVESIGIMLKEHFPYQRDDTDELHNLIIR